MFLKRWMTFQQDFFWPKRGNVIINLSIRATLMPSHGKDSKDKMGYPSLDTFKNLSILKITRNFFDSIKNFQDEMSSNDAILRYLRTWCWSTFGLSLEMCWKEIFWKNKKCVNCSSRCIVWNPYNCSTLFVSLDQNFAKDHFQIQIRIIVWISTVINYLI